jgi:hypothetical protein
LAGLPQEERRGSAELLTLAGHELAPAIYGPSGDLKWDEADPTYPLEAAKRAGK